MHAGILALDMKYYNGTTLKKIYNNLKLKWFFINSLLKIGKLTPKYVYNITLLVKNYLLGWDLNFTF